MEYQKFVRLHRRFGVSEDSTTRRDMIRQMLVLGTSAFCGETGADAQSAPRARKQPPKRVIVVGAGLAGLSCAYELTAAGCDVTVLEARTRLGGRVNSLHDIAKGCVVEAGGEFIGANHPLWLAYAHKFSIKLTEADADDEAGVETYRLGGQTLSESERRHLHHEMNQAFATLTEAARSVDASAPWQSPDAVRLDDRSVADWIADLKCAPRSKRALRAYFIGLNGMEPERQSYLALLAAVRGGGLERFWTDSEVYRCREGNQRLASCFAKSLKKMYLNTSVSAIHIDSERVTVTCASGRKFHADDVVLTVPPSVWHKIDFSPLLPEALRPQMGANVKYLARVKKRFWKAHHQAADATSDQIIHSVWEGTAQTEENENAVLIAFTGGEQATELHRMAEEERERKYHKQLEALFPGFEENFAAGRFVDWIGDAWSQGSYSFPAPGQVVAQGKTLNSVFQGRLHFAGEHTCLKFVGYMEGALQSGVTVARRIALGASA